MLNEVAGWIRDKFTDGPAPTDAKEASGLVPNAVPPDLGDALLSPGPQAKKAEAKVILPALLNWDEEARTDLPPRSPEQIRRLLEFETEAQTQARILNDHARYVNHRAGRSAPSPQSAIISPGEYPSNTMLVKR